jgi:TRAP-type mannitol/chloroaromatic compound transport system permease large subunit
MLMTWLLIILAGFFLAAGTALAYVVGSLGVFAFWLTDNARYLAILPQRIFSQIDVFALMAMVLFILTGEIMNRTGVTKNWFSFQCASSDDSRGDWAMSIF